MVLACVWKRPVYTRSHHVPSWDWEYASFVLHNSQVHQELLGYTTEDSAAFDNITV